MMTRILQIQPFEDRSSGISGSTNLTNKLYIIHVVEDKQVFGRLVTESKNVVHAVRDDASLTSLLDQDEQQTRHDLQDLRHDDGRRGEEAVARQRAHIPDAEDERGILDHQHGQADVLQPLVHCGDRGTKV